MFEQFVPTKRYFIAVQALLNIRVFVKLTIFGFDKLYRDIINHMSYFFTQERDEDFLRRFCRMGNVSNRFALFQLICSKNCTKNQHERKHEGEKLTLQHKILSAF